MPFFGEKVVHEARLNLIRHNFDVIGQHLCLHPPLLLHFITFLEFRSLHVVFEAERLVPQLLLNSLEEGEMQQCGQFNLPAPRLILQLHSELHMLEQSHEFSVDGQAVGLRLIHHVYQGEQAIHVWNDQIKGRKVVAVNAEALPWVKHFPLLLNGEFLL